MSNIHHLEVKLLGGFSLAIDGQSQIQINQLQQQALMAYLMLRAHTPQPRKQIAFLFWPDHNEQRAYANLRRALHKLRSDCPLVEHFLTSTSTMLCWQRKPQFSLDVLDYEELLTQAQKATDQAEMRRLLTQAASLYKGELLPGHFDEWLLHERERLEQSYIHLLHRLIDLYADEEAYETAIEYATRLRHTDPYREQTYRLLMLLHARSGDRAAALRVYPERNTEGALTPL